MTATTGRSKGQILTKSLFSLQKLADFGLATWCKPLNSASSRSSYMRDAGYVAEPDTGDTLCGTLPYLSP